MPTYDYECTACSHAFELFQSIMAEPEKKCPECGKKKLRRLIGPGAAIVFKGSGFYKTDYRSESYKKAAAADSSSGGATSGKGSDTKGAETKASESKGSESKSSDAKPAAAKPSKSSKKD